MSTLCAITGTLKDLSGNVLPNTQVTFVRSGIAAQDGATIIPNVVRATSDSSGVLSVNLYAGNYIATALAANIAGDTGLVSFNVAVPAQATAVLSVLFNAAPTTVTPQAVLDAQAARDAAAASATSAATSATEAEGWANASAASAALAASVMQQDLSAFSVTLSNYTPVDVVVGRMADWSDGGFNMRVIQPRTSWYNETLVAGNWLGEAADETAARAISGAGTGSYYHNTTDGKFYSLNATSGQTEVFRGNKAGFPEEYVVVAEASRVIIFDATDPDLPMWMVLSNATSGSALGNTTSNEHAVAIADGVLVGGSAFGATIINFLSDSIYKYRSGSGPTYEGDFNGTISDRNTAAYYAKNGTKFIAHDTVNDAAITVLPDAPINPATGMPYVTIAVATDGGLSQIGWDGNGNTDAVWDVTYNSWSAELVTWLSDGKFAYAANADARRWLVYDGPVTADDSGGTKIHIYGDPATAGVPHILTNASTGSSGPYSSLIGATIGSPLGLTQVKENPATPASGMVNYLTTTYLSGWMPGDIRGAWLADTTAETITGAELVADGTMGLAATSASPSTAWTFSADIGDVNTTVANKMYIKAGINGYARNLGGTVADHTKPHVLTFEITNSSANAGVRVYLTNTSGTNLASLEGGYYYTGNGTHILDIPANFVSTDYKIAFYRYSGHTGTLEIDNVSLRPGVMDRSVKNSGLMCYGSLTKAEAATGADLVAFSGFSATNYLEQPYNSDLDFGTGDFCIMGWFKATANYAAHSTMLHRTAPGGAGGLMIRAQASTGFPQVYLSNSAAFGLRITGSHKISDNRYTYVAVIRSSGTLYVYVDGILDASVANTTDITYINASTVVGRRQDVVDSAAGLALLRIGATAPSADQIKHIYETEKVLFQDNAKCTLYGSSDAVTDMAYDEIKGLLHVGTSGGRSTFDGLRRIDNSTTAVTKLAANNGLLVEM